MTWFEPYDTVVAARWLGAALGVCAAGPLLSAPWAHPSVLGLAPPILLSLLCAVTATAIWCGWRPGALAWAGCMSTTTVLIVVCDLVTHDAGFTGLFTFLVAPVLAAALLDRRGAWTSAAAGSLGVLVVCSVLLPWGAAATSWTVFSAVLGLLTALLARASHHNHRLTAALRRQAGIDSLTGLVTRRVLDDAMSMALHDPAADRGTGLIIVDLDHFKDVNDTHGHLVGDAALQHVGALLAGVVGTSAVVSRLGGDELAALVPDASADLVATLAHGVARAVRSCPLSVEGRGEIGLTVSVGAAHSPQGARDGTALHRASDEALYVAKRAGRDQAHAAGAPSPAPAPVRPDPVESMALHP